jgi:hypothetical protein
MFQRLHQLHLEVYLEKGTAVCHIHTTGRIKVQEWGKRTQWKAAEASLETALSSLTQLDASGPRPHVSRIAQAGPAVNRGFARPCTLLADALRCG